MKDWIVPLVPVGREREWKDRNPENGPASSAAVEADQDGSLTRAVTVRARSKAEAIELAEAKNRGWRAWREGVEPAGR